MTKNLILLYLSFFNFLISQQSATMEINQKIEQIKDKELKNQLEKHLKISNEIIQILNADKIANEEINKRIEAKAILYRKENKMPSDSPIQFGSNEFKLSRQDSLTFKLLKQDSLLQSKYKEFTDVYLYSGKLSDKDKAIKKDFYQYYLQFINNEYVRYVDTNLSNQKNLKNYFSSGLPEILKCKEPTENPLPNDKCFSKIVMEEINENYDIPDFINEYEEGLKKTKFVSKIDESGYYKFVRLENSSNDFFVDMLTVSIAKKLFKRTKLTNLLDDDYYFRTPLTFDFEE